MRDTCLSCPPQRIEEATGNEFYVFSFFEDILRVVSINDVTLLIQDTIYRLTQDIQAYTQKWVSGNCTEQFVVNNYILYISYSLIVKISKNIDYWQLLVSLSGSSFWMYCYFF